MMRFFYRLLAFIFFTLFSNKASTQLSDSLYKILPKGIKPANPKSLTRFEKRILLENAGVLPRTYLPEVTKLAEQLAEETEEIAHTEEKLLIWQKIGRYYIDLKEFSSPIGKKTNAIEAKAMLYYQKVITSAQHTPKYQQFISDAYNNIGVIYFRKDMYDSSAEYCNKCIDICRRTKDTARLLDAYSLKGDIYMVMDQMDQALEANDQAFALISQKWSEQYLDRYFFKMRCLLVRYVQGKDQRYADSVKVFARTIFTHITKESYYYFRTYEVLSRLYYAQRNYKMALTYIDSSLAVREYDKSSENLSIRNFLRNRYLIRLGNPVPALQLLDSMPVTSYNNRKIMYEELYNQAVEDADWKNALNYYRQFKANSDSLRMTDVNALIYEAEQKYAVSDKQARIVALENTSLLRENAQRRVITIAACTVLLLLLLVAILVGKYRFLQVKRNGEKQSLTAELYSLEAVIFDERQQQQEKITAQRHKIAEDMHDEVSSGLAAFRFYIVDLKTRSNNAETTEILSALEEEAKALYQQVRDFMHNLNENKPGSGYDVCELAEQLSARFVNEKLLLIQHDIDRDGVLEYFTGEMHYQLYLVIKEAVANSIKHAGASKVQISITFRDHSCFFSISDNGKGFRHRHAGSDGMGLQSMAKRVDMLLGKHTIRSDSNGTVIEGFFPV